MRRCSEATGPPEQGSNIEHTCGRTPSRDHLQETSLVGRALRRPFLLLSLSKLTHLCDAGHQWGGKRRDRRTGFNNVTMIMFCISISIIPRIELSISPSMQWKCPRTSPPKTFKPTLCAPDPYTSPHIPPPSLPSWWTKQLLNKDDVNDRLLVW